MNSFAEDFEKIQRRVRMRQKTVQTYLTVLLAVALMLVVSCTSAQPAANAPAEKPTQPAAKTEEAKPTEKPAATEAPAATKEAAPAATEAPAAAATTEASAGGSCSAYPTGTAERIESVDIEKEFGPLPEPKPGLKMAYVTKTLINEFWQDVAVGIQDEAKKHGIEVQIQAAKDESSLSEQLDLAQTILSQKPDALLISPQSDSNLVPVIEAAKELNIPTVIIDDARTEGASTYVGTDQVAIGAKAAEYIHKMFPDGGKVAQIEGQAGSPNARNRIKGFKDTVAKYSNLNLVASQPGNWDRLTALNAATNILQENPDLIAFYANNDGMALGVLEAVKNTGSKAIVVGTDGIREAKKSIGDGGMASTVAEFPYDEGILGVQMALRLNCRGYPALGRFTQAVIEKDNLDKFPNPPGFEQPGAAAATKEAAPAATEAPAAAATTEASAGGSCSAYQPAPPSRSSRLILKKSSVHCEPKPGLKMAYVTKTLINEFWQDVSVGIQDEAKKYGIEVQIQAAKDESSLSEQLDLPNDLIAKARCSVDLTAIGLQPGAGDRSNQRTNIPNRYH
ncbi:MAG: substrate-binding domain-containing protein [Anaerolineae bacterium]